LFAKKQGILLDSNIFFMGGGGLGTAIGSRIVQNSSLNTLFMVYGIGLVLLIIAVLFIKKSFVLENV
jgi:predicted MFS family arabinose efflux permease